MNKYNGFAMTLKRYRHDSGLTQEEAAEKLGVSVNTIQNWESGKTSIKNENLRKIAILYQVPFSQLQLNMNEEGRNKTDNWPAFLFDTELRMNWDDNTNEIIGTLHLSLEEQNLFGLMYIYGAKYLKKSGIDYNTFYDDLNVVPYSFVDRVGSIQFVNMADRLHEVVKHVKADYLMKVLKLFPDEEFNIRYLPKDLICEFIDSGHKELSDGIIDHEKDGFEGNETLHFYISMQKAKAVLPLLEKGPIILSNGCDARGIWRLSKDIPDELITACGWNIAYWNYLKNNHKINSNKYTPEGICNNVEIVTKQRRSHDEWRLELNDLGKQLLDWFRKGE